MFNQLVNFHSYYNPFRLQLSMYLPAPGPVQLLLVHYISAVINQARFLPAPHTTMHPSPAALHVIARAQFLSQISISTSYPAPHQMNVSSGTSTGGLSKYLQLPRSMYATS